MNRDEARKLIKRQHWRRFCRCGNCGNFAGAAATAATAAAAVQSAACALLCSLCRAVPCCMPRCRVDSRAALCWHGYSTSGNLLLLFYTFPCRRWPSAAWQSSRAHTSCHTTHTHTPADINIWVCVCASYVPGQANPFASSHANNLMAPHNVRCKILFNTPTHTLTHTHTGIHKIHPRTHTQSESYANQKKTLRRN